MNSSPPESLLKFNPNGLLLFKKLFLLFKPIPQKECLYLSLRLDPPTVLFLAPIISKDSRFYASLRLADEFFLDEITSSVEARAFETIEIQEALLFWKFIKGFTDKASSFAIHCSQVLSLMYSEGSEIRTRTLNIERNTEEILKKQCFPIEIAFMGQVPSKDFIKMSDFVIRTDSDLIMRIIGNNEKDNKYFMNIVLETKGEMSMFFGIKEVPAKAHSLWKENFDKSFLIDKQRAKILQSIANIEETCVVGITKDNQDLCMKFMKEKDDGDEIMYEMCFLLPYLDDFDDNFVKKEEQEEEKIKEEEEDEQYSSQKKKLSFENNKNIY